MELILDEPGAVIGVVINHVEPATVAYLEQRHLTKQGLLIHHYKSLEKDYGEVGTGQRRCIPGYKKHEW